MAINVSQPTPVTITVVSQQPLVVNVQNGGAPIINIIAPGSSPGTINSITNVGSGIGIAKPAVAGNVYLKSILAGAGIEIVDNGDDLTIKTINGNTIWSGGTPPPSPNIGDIYYDDGNNILYAWSGTVWEHIVFSSQLADPVGTLLVSGGSF